MRTAVRPKASTARPNGVEGGVAVVEEEPRVRVVGEGLAELLSGPCGRGVWRHIDMQDASPVVGQDHEDE